MKGVEDGGAHDALIREEGEFEFIDRGKVERVEGEARDGEGKVRKGFGNEDTIFESDPKVVFVIESVQGHPEAHHPKH